jgi:hypothetical protein
MKRVIKKYHSPSTNAFYSSDIHGTRMPADVVEITHAEWESLLAEQSAGKQIVPGSHGHPVAIERKPTPENILRARDRLLRDSDSLVTRHRDEVEYNPANTTLAPDQYAALQAWRRALRQIESSPGFPDVVLPVSPV